MTDNPIHPAVQMRRNFDALCRYRLLDSLGLMIIEVDSDRVWCSVPKEAEQDLLTRFDQLEMAGDLGSSEGRHTPPTRIMDLFMATCAVKIRNCRGRLPNGIHGDQWIVYRMSYRELSHGLLVEMDVDQQSPVDAVGFFPHLWTVIKHRIRKAKTDPFEVADGLRGAGVNV